MGRAELSTRAKRGQRIQFQGKGDIFSVGVRGGHLVLLQVLENAHGIQEYQFSNQLIS